MSTDSQTAKTRRRVRILWQLGCASIVLAVLVLATTSWTVYSNWSDARIDYARAQSNRSYLRTVNGILTLLDDAENGQRGYLLTGHLHYLDPYNRAIGPLNQSLKALSKVAVDRPEERDTIERLQSLTRDKMAEMALTIHLHEMHGRDAALTEVMTDKGLKAMNEVRNLGRSIAETQRADVARRSDASEKHQLAAIELASAGGLLLLGLMVAGFIALTSSGSQQALLAERLADSREIFETTLTSIGDGVIATDTEGRIDFMNPEAEALTGWPRSEAKGKQLDEIFHIVNETTREAVENPFTKVMRTGTATSLANHTILIRRGGPEVCIDDSGAPIRNVHGQVRGVVLVFRGIDERRRAEAALARSHNELLKANEELRQFSYAATHDLQEPLRTIVVFSQLLGRGYKEILDERGNHLLKTIEDAGNRMSSLINDLLAFTRVGSTDASSDGMAVNAAEVLQDALVPLKGSIEETKATITYDNLPEIWSEPAQLSQLFQNLISNAIKYRRAGLAPVIRVSGKVDGEFATFEVADNGMGFKQEYAERIFQLFQRLHGRSIPGTGIGLALCRRIVERQGGRIWAISSENMGATFFFTLPSGQSEVAIPKQ